MDELPDTNREQFDIANSDSSFVEEDLPSSSLLASVLFSMTESQRKYFFESASFSGVAYTNRTPSCEEPIVLKLTRTVQEQWQAMKSTAEQEVNTLDLEGQRDLLAALKNELEAGVRISYHPTTKTVDELLKDGLPINIYSGTFRLSCKLYPKENQHNASFIATHMKPCEPSDKSKTEDLHIKWSWELRPYNLMEPLYFDTEALRGLISELSYKVRPAFVGRRTAQHLGMLDMLVKINQFSAMHRYELLSRESDRLSLKILGPQEKINEIAGANLYTLGEKNQGIQASSPHETISSKCLPKPLHIVIEKVPDLEDDKSDIYLFSCTRAEEVPSSGYIMDIGEESQLQKELNAIELVRKGCRNSVLHLMKLAALQGEIRFSKLEAYSLESDIDFVDQHLTQDQREAIAKSIYTPDICLIQGPPGTGKTHIICEIIQQAIARGWKTLFVAPTHVAVDNVLERIGDMDNVNPVRCASQQKMAELSDFIRQFTYEQRIESLPQRCCENVGTHISKLDIRISNALTVFGELSFIQSKLGSLQQQERDLLKAQASVIKDVKLTFKIELKDAQANKKNALKQFVDAEKQLKIAQSNLTKAGHRAQQVQSDNHSRQDLGRLKSAEAEVTRIYDKEVTKAKKEQETVKNKIISTENTIAKTQVSINEAEKIVFEMDAGRTPAKVEAAIRSKVEQVSAEHDRNIDSKDSQLKKAEDAHNEQQRKVNKLQFKVTSIENKLCRLSDIRKKRLWRQLWHLVWWISFLANYGSREAKYLTRLQTASELLASFKCEVEKVKCAAQEARETKSNVIASVRSCKRRRLYEYYKSRCNWLPKRLCELNQKLASEKAQLEVTTAKLLTAEKILKDAIQQAKEMIIRQIRKETAVRVKEARKELHTCNKTAKSLSQALQAAQETLAKVQSRIDIVIERERQRIESNLHEVMNKITRFRKAVEVRERFVNELPDETLVHKRVKIKDTVERLSSAIRTTENQLMFLKDWHEYIERESDTLGQRLAKYINLVCATTIGIASEDFSGKNGFLGQKEFDLLIVDEASKVTEAEFLVAGTRAKRWVLLGDHKQLPPYYDRRLDRFLSEFDNIQEDTSKIELNREILSKSLFERLWLQFETYTGSNLDRAKSRLASLNIQRRMHPDLALFISDMYYGGKYQSPSEAGFAESKSMDLSHFKYPVTFIEVCPPKGNRGFEVNLKNGFERKKLGLTRRSGFANTQEAEQVIHVLEWLLREDKIYQEQEDLSRNDDRVPAIGIICFYAGQVELIRQMIQKSTFIDAQKESESEADFLCRDKIHVVVNSVDAFQGKECPVIILSFTRSNPYKNIGFVDDANRLNVAISRARKKLILLGDTKTFINRSKADDREIEDCDDTASAKAESDFFAKLVRHIEEGYGEFKKVFQTRGPDAAT